MGPKTMVYEPLPEANLHHVVQAFTLSNAKMWMPQSLHVTEDQLSVGLANGDAVPGVYIRDDEDQRTSFLVQVCCIDLMKQEQALKS